VATSAAAQSPASADRSRSRCASHGAGCLAGSNSSAPAPPVAGAPQPHLETSLAAGHERQVGIVEGRADGLGRGGSRSLLHAREDGLDERLPDEPGVHGDEAGAWLGHQPGADARQVAGSLRETDIVGIVCVRYIEPCVA
jgi:hypothetical protein